MKHMDFEQRPSSTNWWRHKSALNPTVNECPNEYQSDELKLAMEILDMELRADRLMWHKESEVSVGRTRGIVIRFNSSVIKFK
jgi:hypothetical protein